MHACTQCVHYAAMKITILPRAPLIAPHGHHCTLIAPYADASAIGWALYVDPIPIGLVRKKSERAAYQMCQQQQQCPSATIALPISDNSIAHQREADWCGSIMGERGCRYATMLSIIGMHGAWPWVGAAEKRAQGRSIKKLPWYCFSHLFHFC